MVTLIVVPRPEALSTSNVPFKKMSNFGGDYLAWSRDGKNVTWSWGTKFFRQGVGVKHWGVR